ncbi:MAG: 2-C-methyl-D-erythritol 4-phosphate cytidylyltransferase [SAR324 cluster bacterium]|uniref:2-C-methyl-D-erythritol 4-phosphate cytidylyltransferase n=1 Tax=SAR324 cluster bacterium TaxID=2024889 RepID=A0A7X9FPV6_9DELT|nr:2-C-methyl-D-erythritol 4-phosphate cytidylyltransferase [SAR324 cluster bacterium]
MQPHQVIAIVPAAGKGLRFSSSKSKLLEKVRGKPIIFHTIEKLLSMPEVGDVIIATRQEDEESFKSILPESERIAFVRGGSTRSMSVRNALEYIEKNLTISKDEQLIAVHDAARCCISHGLMKRAIEAARVYKAISVGMPLSDSLKEVDFDRKVLDSKLRERYWTVQTPQVFIFSILLQAHKQGVEECTDDAGLVEALHPVYMVEGEKSNIKITTQEDLKLAEFILAK